MSEEEKKAIENVKSMFEDITIEELLKDKNFNITIYSLGILDILRVIAIVEKRQKEIEEFEQRLDDEIERCDSICVNCSFREEFCKELVRNRQCVPRNDSTNYNKNKGEIV